MINSQLESLAIIDDILESYKELKGLEKQKHDIFRKKSQSRRNEEKEFKESQNTGCWLFLLYMVVIIWSIVIDKNFIFIVRMLIMSTVAFYVLRDIAMMFRRKDRRDKYYVEEQAIYQKEYEDCKRQIEQTQRELNNKLKYLDTPYKGIDAVFFARKEIQDGTARDLDEAMLHYTAICNRQVAEQRRQDAADERRSQELRNYAVASWYLSQSQKK